MGDWTGWVAPVAWWADPPLPTLTAANVAGYLYLSVVGALLSYALWCRGVARLPLVAVSSLLLSPVTAVVLGSILAAQWAMSRPQNAGTWLLLDS